jgi:hypothetical protein
LRIQFTRIAQMQAQLDLVLAALRHSSVLAREASPPGRDALLGSSIR